MNPLIATFDTFLNFVTGMGTKADKGTATEFAPFVPMDPVQLLNAYRGDWMSRKIVDLPAYDSTRAWRQWEGADDEQVTLLEKEERRLNLLHKVKTARALARLYGGGAIIIGDGSSNPEAEFKPETVGQGGIKYLLAVSRHALTAGDPEWEPGPNYGLPETFTLQRKDGQPGAKIHHTRVVRFLGAEVPLEEASDVSYWGDSILDAVAGAIKAAGSSVQAVAALLQEAKVDVVGVPGLLNRVANDQDKANLQTKFALSALFKSMFGVTIRDSLEEWEQKQIDFSQMPDLIDRFMQIVAGAADIPATRMLGQSPKGMNATGESDLVNYYDRLRSEQEVIMTPALAPLDEALIRSALGDRPDEVSYVWRPLWQVSDKEKAEIAKAKSDTTRTYVDTGLVPLSALAAGVKNQLIEDGVYPGLEAAMAEAEAAGELAPFEEPEPDPIELIKAEAEAKAAAMGGMRQQPIPQKRAANDASPRPLYVSRPVVNTAEIILWAKEQGFKTTIPADQMHVTIASSRRPVDWSKIPPLEDTISADRGDPDDWRRQWRWVQRLGEDGALVLVFEHPALRERWQAFIDAGASWDFREYLPHVTISYDAAGYLDTSEIEPFLGVIELGPERFDVFDADGYREAIREISTEPQAGA